MSAANHPERFPSDAKLTELNNRVSSLVHKYKVEPKWTAKPTFIMMPYDKYTGVMLIGATLYGAYHLTGLIKTMFSQGIAVNGHPSEHH